MANLHLIIVLSKLIQNICDSGILVSGSKLIFLNVAFDQNISPVYLVTLLNELLPDNYFNSAYFLSLPL